MEKVLRFIDSLPIRPLVILSLAIGLAPWPFAEEPHLVEKARMLIDGTLTRPIDIFDVFYHLTPLVVLGVRLVRIRQKAIPKKEE